MNAIAPQRPSKATHAGAATEALRQAIAAAQKPLRDAVAAYKAAHIQLAAEADLLDALRAAGELVLAAEAIVAAGKQVEATARAAMAQALMDTGACTIRSATHSFSASPGRQSVTVTSADAVPSHLLRQPPPSPDKAKILRLLKAGETIPGCELSNGSQPILTVKAISA
jgi:Siphovirus Gp157